MKTMERGAMTGRDGRDKAAGAGGEHCELLLLPDGRVLVHNLIPVVADILAGLDPGDDAAARRAGAAEGEDVA